MTQSPDRMAIPAGDLESDAARRVEEIGPPTPVPAGAVANLFTALDKAIRSQRLYQSNNPVLHGFLTTARQAFTSLWEGVPSLTLAVEEHSFRWYGRSFVTGESRDGLPYLFYKDGIRFITFMPGFEDELEQFLDVVNRARTQDPLSSDDIVTLFWQQEFTSFRYSYIDVLAEGVQVPQSTVPTLTSVDLTLTRQDAAGELPDEAASPAVEAGQPTVAGLISRDDFEETLYFLEPAELAQLSAEVEKEWSRPIRTDVLNALFDRMESGLPDWPAEILQILRQLLPTYLGEGDLGSATVVLVELGRMLEHGELDAELRTEIQAVFRELSEPALLTQLIRSLEDGSIDPAGSELGLFLRHLGPEAMPVLLGAIERTEAAAVRDRLREASEELGRAHTAELMALLSSADEAVLRGAVRLVGRLGLAAVTGPLSELLARPDARLRRTVVDALVQIRNAQALEGVQRALADADREVRIAAARGIRQLRYVPARERLEKVIVSRAVRDADLTEQIAFFEAYGAIANEAGVGLLDRLLNGRRLLAREGPEIRACAAMALGLVATPAAQAALERARAESNPIIRNAVFKALRGDRS